MSLQVNKTAYDGILAALCSAVLFGAATPVSKVLLVTVNPVLLAGVLYLGSGIGLWLLQLVRQLLRPGKQAEARLKKSDFGWLAAAIGSGGVVGPVLLMFGLTATPAAQASLLLNLEGVLTAALAWFVFKENYDRRLIIGMVAITAGGVLFSAGVCGGWQTWATLAIIGACLCWAADNNLTRKISAGDPLQIAQYKGIVAGVVNCALALATGASIPHADCLVVACLVGFLGCGISLSLFVFALRNIGAARTSAYFSIAPFIGALLSLAALHEPMTPILLCAGLLMGVGVWLHVTERHEHQHCHRAIEHEHSHKHDEHHEHVHDADIPVAELHNHRHRHEQTIHSHPHYPDIHHFHEH